jgi:hypothetical protein
MKTVKAQSRKLLCWAFPQVLCCTEQLLAALSGQRGTRADQETYYWDKEEPYKKKLRGFGPLANYAEPYHIY